VNVSDDAAPGQRPGRRLEVVVAQLEDIRITRKWFDQHYQEWEAEGLVTVWGADVRWRAFLPSACEVWEVEVPGGQNVSATIVDVVIDLFDLIRAHLAVSADMNGSHAAA